MKSVIGIVVFCGAILGPACANQSTGGAHGYAVDADPDEPGVQDTVSVAVGADFAVDQVIVSANDPWSAEQSNMKFDPEILEFVSGPADANLGDAVFCGGTTGADYVYGGCARASGRTSVTGVTRTWQFRCKARGSSSLHLQSSDEVGVATGTNLATANGVSDPGLHDASVTCTGGDGTIGGSR